LDELSERINFNGEIKLKAFFLMANLTKITSKKSNPSFLSFYFELPQIKEENDFKC